MGQVEGLHSQIASRFNEACEGFPVRLMQDGFLIELDPETEADQYLLLFTRLIGALFDIVGTFATEIELDRLRSNHNDSS